MGFKEVMESIKNKIREKQMETRAIKEEEAQLPDDITRDKYLRSLRRQRRVQMEEVEKEQLKKDIADFEKNKLRKEFFGIKDNSDKKKQLLKALNKKKKINMMKEKKYMFRDSSMLRKSGKSRQKEYSFLGKSNL